jgi:coenzyme PQQ precursor peptide PqqA
MFEEAFEPAPARPSQSPTLNLLIRHWFDIPPHKYVKIVSHCSINHCRQWTKISLANFSFRISLSCEGGIRPVLARRAKMAWKTPKIVEVPVGMEINMYACAARK